MNISDNDSDSFVDAEDTFYDSNGRPLNLRFSAVQLSSAARSKLLASLPKEDDKKCIIPEISVTDTSLDDGEQELNGLSDGPDYSLSGSGSLSEDDQTAEADVSSRRDKDNASLTSANDNYPSQTLSETDNCEEDLDVTVYVKDLDTGKQVLATDVEAELKKSNNGKIDPLSFHILKRTGSDTDMGSPRDDEAKHGSGNWNGLSKGVDDDDNNEHDKRDREKNGKHHRPRSFLNRLKKRSSHHEKGIEDADDNFLTGNTAPVYSDVQSYDGQAQPRYIKVRTRFKTKKDFNRLFLSQELFNPNTQSSKFGPSKTGAIWIMKFSKDGKFLATGGQDAVVRVWAVISSDEEREHFAEGSGTSIYEGKSGAKLGAPVFRDKPMYEYHGHAADVLDLSWSKNNFLLSSSMDKTVRLWHITRSECLCCFQHTDFVTAIAFHPKDDRFFLSGSLDCKLRLWNIPDKKVAYWNELDSQLITAVGFSLDGRISVAGSFTGLCLFYETEGLKYNTQIHVKSSRGRNSKGKKITGIEAMPGTLPGQDKILISSNDSRIRLYNMRDKSLECKYKGLENTCSQIRATFSDDGRYIICGSEDRNVCIWNTDQSGMHTSKSSGGGFLLKKDKASYEYFEAHSSIVTVAIFAPTRTKRLIAQCGDPIFVRTHQDNTEEDSSGLPTYPDGNIIVCADYNGSIKVFRNDCAYYPNQDTDNASIRSNRSWMNNLVAFGTRRQSDASSVFSAGSRSTRGGSVNDEKAAGQQVKCLCGSTDFKAFLGGSPTLVCVGCGKSSDVRV